MHPDVDIPRSYGDSAHTIAHSWNSPDDTHATPGRPELSGLIPVAFSEPGQFGRLSRIIDDRLIGGAEMRNGTYQLHLVSLNNGFEIDTSTRPGFFENIALVDYHTAVIVGAELDPSAEPDRQIGLQFFDITRGFDKPTAQFAGQFHQLAVSESGKRVYATGIHEDAGAMRPMIYSFDMQSRPRMNGSADLATPFAHKICGTDTHVFAVDGLSFTS